MKKTNDLTKNTMWLQIANCRGRRPVIRQIEKARGLINSLLIELNPCEAKDELKKCDSILWDILCENDNPLNLKK